MRLTAAMVCAAVSPLACMPAVAAVMQPIALAPWGWSAMRDARGCLNEVRKELLGPDAAVPGPGRQHVALPQGADQQDGDGQHGECQHGAREFEQNAHEEPVTAE